MSRQIQVTFDAHDPAALDGQGPRLSFQRVPEGKVGIRATALGVAAAAQWLANFAISTSFPRMAEAGLGFAYGFYTFFALVSFFFVLKFVPETNGRELEDMT